MVGLQPDIILASATPATAAVQRETRTIPIVFANAADPVASGLVARLDRPSGNVTGFATFEAPLGGKWLELLSEIAPGLKRVAAMSSNMVAISQTPFYAGFWPCLCNGSTVVCVMPPRFVLTLSKAPSASSGRSKAAAM